jgi:hypothetical protein
MSFHSKLFQELEGSYLKLHEREIEKNRRSMDEALVELIEFFK